MLSRRTKTCVLVMVLAACGWLAFAGSVRAQDVDETTALKVKAAFLLNFAKFIKWPDDAFVNDSVPFVISVLGDDPFGRILDKTVEDRQVAGRPVGLRRLRWQDLKSGNALKNYQVLYICASERHRLDDIVAALDALPVLLVSDIHESARDGGMVEFVLKNGRIAFEVNREALKRAGLKASPRLLKLARIVEPRSRAVQVSSPQKRGPK